MRIGMLTGGGDCPGLERRHPRGDAAARRRRRRAGRRAARLARHDRRALPPARPRGRLGHPPARRHDPAHEPHQSVQRSTAASRRCSTSFEQLDGLIAIGGEDTLGVAARLHGEHRPARRRRAEDDRQRPRRDRPDVRLRHGGLDRDRGDRPPAHDGRVARPRDRRRGHGPPRRLARRRERHRRRRRRRADPRVPAHRRALRRADPAAARARQGLLDRRRQRGLAADARGGRRGALDARPASVDAFGHVRLGGVGQQLADAARADHRLRDARDDARAPAARRHADRLRPHPRDALRAARGRARARGSASAR